MIENKTVTITKKNRFDKGWTLFEPFESNVAVNRAYRELMLADIVKAITFADEVHLVLSEMCLSNRIVEELKWVNKHVKLHAIVKSKELISNYPQLHFDTVKIVNTVNFNYVGVTGRQKLTAMLTDSFYEVDGTVEEVYFNDKKADANYDCLNDAVKVFVADSNGTGDYGEVITQAKKRKCKVYYVVSVSKFNRKVFDLAKGYGIDLLVSDFVGNGVLIVRQNNQLSVLTLLKGNLPYACPIRDAFAFFGKQYKCCFLNDVLDSDKLNGNYYTCFGGKISKLNIEPSLVKEITVPIATMEHFVNAQFDSSVCDKHNDYSAIAQKVEYRFTLTPPIMDDSYTVSHVYDGINALTEQWRKLQTLKFNRIRDDYYGILLQDYGLINCLGTAQQFTKRLTEKVSKINYANYYSDVETTLKLFTDTHKLLSDIFTSMFDEIYTAHSTTRFVKFDAEIEGYRQTIAEKTALIEQGVNVLTNKRRVEILNKKINDLLMLKKKFSGDSSATASKEHEQFAQLCKAILNRTFTPSKVVSNESIENIVKSREEKPEEKLEAFAQNYLYAINEYLISCIEVLNKLSQEQIPENYVVYEKDSQRYVAIDDESEYEQTKTMCNKFNILCLARR